MTTRAVLVSIVLVGSAAAGLRLAPAGTEGNPLVSLVKMTHRGERNLPDLSEGPDALEPGSLAKLLEGRGCRMGPVTTVALSADEQKSSAEWNRLALANGQLAKIVAKGRQTGYVPRGPAGELQQPGGHAGRAPVAIAAAAITEMFTHEKVAALGVASTPFGDRDRDGLLRQAAYALILGAVDGLAQRARGAAR